MNDTMLVVRRCGKCVVVAQALGWEYDGQTTYGHFAALCIDGSAKPCMPDDAAHFIRLTKTHSDPNRIEQLTNYCSGYSAAIEHRNHGHTYGSIPSDMVSSAQFIRFHP